MPRIAGITIEKKPRTKNFKLVIDYKKHPELVERILEEKGLANPITHYDPKFVKQIRKSELEPTIDVDLSKYGIEI